MGFPKLNIRTRKCYYVHTFKNNSLNVQCLSFLLHATYLFTMSKNWENEEKCRAKNYFSHFTSSCSKRMVVFFCFFFSQKCSNLRHQKMSAAFFFFPNIFFDKLLLIVFIQKIFSLKRLVKYIAITQWVTHY